MRGWLPNCERQDCGLPQAREPLSLEGGNLWGFPETSRIARPYYACHRVEMRELSEKLLSLVEVAEPRLHEIGERGSIQPILPGGWSRKQVVGHLIDSASNNHQRFVRAVLQTSLDFPGYDQSGSVRVQAVQGADWKLLVSLWAAYNRYLAHVIAQLPASKLKTACRIGSGDAVTLEFLATDYVRHLVHHLNQLGAADRTSPHRA
jgi:DinB superfamily